MADPNEPNEIECALYELKIHETVTGNRFEFQSEITRELAIRSMLSERLTEKYAAEYGEQREKVARLVERDMANSYIGKVVITQAALMTDDPAMQVGINIVTLPTVGRYPEYCNGLRYDLVVPSASHGAGPVRKCVVYEGEYTPRLQDLLIALPVLEKDSLDDVLSAWASKEKSSQGNLRKSEQRYFVDETLAKSGAQSPLHVGMLLYEEYLRSLPGKDKEQVFEGVNVAERETWRTNLPIIEEAYAYLKKLIASELGSVSNRHLVIKFTEPAAVKKSDGTGETSAKKRFEQNGESGEPTKKQRVRIAAGDVGGYDDPNFRNEGKKHTLVLKLEVHFMVLPPNDPEEAHEDSKEGPEKNDAAA